jgi:hypothetical protein
MEDSLRVEIQQMLSTERREILEELERKLPAYLQSPKMAKAIVKSGAIELVRSGVMYPVVTLKSLLGIQPARRAPAVRPADAIPHGDSGFEEGFRAGADVPVPA